MPASVILVVEDEHDIRVTLRQVLEEEGYVVVSAANGASALALLGEITRPSLILLDRMMPIMSGEEFLKQIASSPSLSSIPVVMISAAVPNETPAGVSGCLPKPLDWDLLIEAIKSCISKAASRPSAP